MKKSTLLVLALSLSFATAYAQTSEERVLNSAPINVDGYLHEEAPVSDSELESLKSTVKKYKNDNKLYKEKSKELGKVSAEAEKIGENAEEKIMAQVEAKKAETKAMEKIKKAEEKLKCLMDGNSREECAVPGSTAVEEVQEVRIAQAAPVVSTAEVAPIAVGNPFEVIKLLPYAGATNFSGKSEQLETELAAGLRLESNITTRFSMGIGFNVAQLKTNDFASNSSYMNPGYFGAYGQQGREIQYRSMGLDLYGKFFITNGERFRPYIGAGLGYNRAAMKYNSNSPFINNSGLYGSEEFNTSFASGLMMLGSEIMVTRGFGINIEGAYSTGIGDSLSSKATKSVATSPDQARLNTLGKEIINANALSIFAGAVVNF